MNSFELGKKVSVLTKSAAQPPGDPTYPDTSLDLEQGGVPAGASQGPTFDVESPGQNEADTGNQTPQEFSLAPGSNQQLNGNYLDQANSVYDQVTNNLGNYQQNLPYAGVGAGLGALLGSGLTEDDDDTLRNALLSALAGGGLGYLGGSYLSGEPGQEGQ